MTKTRISIIKLMAVSALLLFAVSAKGQSYRGDIAVLPVRYERSVDSVYVDMDIRFSDVRVKQNTSVELVPCLMSPAGDYHLPAVSVMGRTVYKAWERESAMYGRSQDAASIVKGYKTDTVINYRYAIPYEDWMDDAVLNLCEYDSGCGRSMLTEVKVLFGRMIAEIPVSYTPLLAYVVPEVEEVKKREQEVEFLLDFVVNKTNINPSYMNNSLELARIRSIIDELESDPVISVAAIEIIGYASPEGSLAGNRRLSEGRAMSMRNYLASLYDFPQDIYSMTFGGENWDGLVRELQAKPIDNSQEVLNIIETTSPDQVRKNRIMGLREGAPYRYMKTNIYPMLRTAVSKIEYQVKGFDATDAVEVYRTRPQDLNLSEFYMVAGTMAEGSPEFVEVFETALSVYPDDEIANLNAAIAALQEKDTLKAAALLGKVVENRSLPEYHNAMGALLLLQHDVDGARVHFELAAGESEAARGNLKMISKQQ